MYDKNAELFHQPITRIFDAGFCCCCCSAYPETVACKILVQQIGSLQGQSYVMCNFAFVRGWPFLDLKKGPSSLPQMTICANTPVIGHNKQLVLPTRTSTPFPFPVGPSLTASTSLARCFGDCGSSIATSPKLKCFPESQAFSVGTVNSPHLKKPKKHRTAAPHNIIMSASVALVDRSSASVLCTPGMWVARILNCIALLQRTSVLTFA